MECPLPNGVRNLQSMQRKEKDRRASESSIIGHGGGGSGLLREKFHQKTGVGVNPHRRDSRTIFDRLIFDGFSRTTSSSTSSIARTRSASSASVPFAG